MAPSGDGDGGALLSGSGGDINSNLRSTIRHIGRHRARSRRGLALLEGVRLVEEAVQSGVPFRGAVVSGELDHAERGSRLRQVLVARGVRLEEASIDDLRELATTENPQGIVAVARPRSWRAEDIRVGGAATVLVLDAVQDPGNVGALVRTAFALGATGTIVLPGTSDPYTAKALRGAMGATFRHPVVRLDQTAFGAWAQSERCAVWVADTSGGPARSASRSQPVALVVGNEGAGASTDLLARADRRIGIPMVEGAESLNVVVAAGILLYEVLRSD